MTKKLHLISKKIKDVDAISNMSSYMGKDVYSKSGEYLGKVKELNLNNAKVEGATISGRVSFYVDKEYFDLNNEDVIIMNIDPVVTHIGKKVFDKEGKDLGYVRDLERKTNSNSFISLIVSKSIIGKKLYIPKEDISVSKTSIILKKVYEVDESLDK